MLLTMKSTGIDLSTEHSLTGASKLSGPQLKFFCSQFGQTDAQDEEIYRQCSSEYAKIIAARDHLCVGKKGEHAVISDGENNKCNTPTKASGENCKEKK